ncbi:MAG: hypothetical protein ACLUAR_17925 [Pilosibacter sp.]
MWEAKKSRTRRRRSGGSGRCVQPTNIICIKNESLSGPVGDNDDEYRVFPFLNSLTENTVKGKTLHAGVRRDDQQL